jgi:hypothetical protein
VFIGGGRRIPIVTSLRLTERNTRLRRTIFPAISYCICFREPNSLATNQPLSPHAICLHQGRWATHSFENGFAKAVEWPVLRAITIQLGFPWQQYVLLFYVQQHFPQQREEENSCTHQRKHRPSLQVNYDCRCFVDLSHRLPECKQLYPVNLYEFKSISILNVWIQHGLQILVLIKFYEYEVSWYAWDILTSFMAFGNISEN